MAAVSWKVAVVAGAALFSAAAPAWAAKPGGGNGGSTSGPTAVYPGDFPDPAVVWTPSGYYAYATQTGDLHIQVMASSTDQSWSSPTEALSGLPQWDLNNGLAANTWAPSVQSFGSNWVMWYTAYDSAANKQCLSVATSSTPSGPFADTSGGAPAYCDTNGSIDPNIFVDGGSAYLLWKSNDNSVGLPTRLWSEPLNATGTALASGTTPTKILTEDAHWQSPSMEGPTMVANGGTYYLFYGANNWDSSSAGIGYATCASPVSACTDQSTGRAWLSSAGSALGPSGPDIFTDGSGTHLAYHAWDGCVGYPGCNRALYIGSLSFTNGVPKLS
ncbi:MAG TPA: glycoside hydrolase family 43 protein [Acidimicrobiales bacterium]|nr:glycoside hydrolase family 43 protein [Acidimicrobiales bacterium]